MCACARFPVQDPQRWPYSTSVTRLGHLNTPASTAAAGGSSKMQAERARVHLHGGGALVGPVAIAPPV
eukprot:3143469-Alexandrium_andersonii.AAC.1